MTSQLGERLCLRGLDAIHCPGAHPQLLCKSRWAAGRHAHLQEPGRGPSAERQHPRGCVSCLPLCSCGVRRLVDGATRGRRAVAPMWAPERGRHFKVRSEKHTHSTAGYELMLLQHHRSQGPSAPSGPRRLPEVHLPHASSSSCTNHSDDCQLGVTHEARGPRPTSTDRPLRHSRRSRRLPACSFEPPRRGLPGVAEGVVPESSPPEFRTREKSGMPGRKNVQSPPRQCLFAGHRSPPSAPAFATGSPAQLRRRASPSPAG